MVWEHDVDYYSNIVAFIWIFISVMIPLLILIVLWNYPKQYTEESLEKARFKVLLEDFKDDKKVNMIDHFIFILRRIGLTLIVVFRWNHGLQQL